jgi:hypothetical protein
VNFNREIGTFKGEFINLREVFHEKFIFASIKILEFRGFVKLKVKF